MSRSGAPAAGERPVYSISAVARMLDVPVATLRTWEDRYGQVVPARNASGHRLFSRDQVEQLAFVRAQMSQGASAADAHRLLAERAETGLPLAPPAPRLLILLAESDPYAAEFMRPRYTTHQLFLVFAVPALLSAVAVALLRVVMKPAAVARAAKATTIP